MGNCNPVSLESSTQSTRQQNIHHISSHRDKTNVILHDFEEQVKDLIYIPELFGNISNFIGTHCPDNPFDPSPIRNETRHVDEVLSAEWYCETYTISQAIAGDEPFMIFPVQMYMDKTGKTPFNLEYRILHQNQNYIWVSAIGETLRDIDGTPRKVAGSIRDISRRKRAEQELAEQTAIVNGILNAAVNSIISFDIEGKILSVNPATGKMFGYAPEEILGKPLDLLIANGKLDFGKMIDNITETEGRRKGNQLFPLEVSLSETNLSDKKIYVGILRDASQRKTQLDELKEKINE